MLFIDEIHRLNRMVEEVLYPRSRTSLSTSWWGRTGGALHPPRPAALHARRRHDAHRAVDGPLARPLRHRVPLAVLFARGAGLHRAPLGVHPGRRYRGRRRARDRTPQPRHAALGEPAAQARARLGAGARRRRHRRGRGRSGAQLLRGGRARFGRGGQSHPRALGRAVRRAARGSDHARVGAVGRHRYARGRVRALPHAAEIYMLVGTPNSRICTGGPRPLGNHWPRHPRNLGARACPGL